MRCGKVKGYEISKKESDPLNTSVNGRQLPQVVSVRYLVSLMTDRASSTEEIRCTILNSKIAYREVGTILTTNKISLQFRKRFPKSSVWCMVLYLLGNLVGEEEREKVPGEWP